MRKSLRSRSSRPGTAPTIALRCASTKRRRIPSGSARAARRSQDAVTGGTGRQFSLLGLPTPPELLLAVLEKPSWT